MILIRFTSCWVRVLFWSSVKFMMQEIFADSLSYMFWKLKSLWWLFFFICVCVMYIRFSFSWSSVLFSLSVKYMVREILITSLCYTFSKLNYVLIIRSSRCARSVRVLWWYLNVVSVDLDVVSVDLGV